jgi:rod shape determining protein RodA
VSLLISILQGTDRRLLLAWIILSLISLAILWSVTEPIRGPYENLDPGVPKSIFYRQMIWIGLGWMTLLVAIRIPLRPLEDFGWVIYAMGLLLLLVVLFAGPSVGGARRWLVLGPVRMQPSELAKVGFILVTASLLSRPQAARRPLFTTLASLFLMVLPFVLVLREPDLGTSLVFPVLWLGMVFWYGVSGVFLLAITTTVLSAVISFYSENVVQQPWPWGAYLLVLIGVLYLGRFRVLACGILLLGNIVSGLGIPYFWDRLKDYQQDRILAFFEPGRDAAGSGYQVIQSKVAIGSGGLFGTQYLQGTQKGLAFLPERHTDFIFSVVGEELGFAGAMALLALFLMVLLRGLDLASSAARPFPGFLAIGIVTYFGFHVLVNVAITIGLLPVTGLPLPFISYGGSNLLISTFLLGLLANAGSRRYEA